MYDSSFHIDGKNYFWNQFQFFFSCFILPYQDVAILEQDWIFFVFQQTKYVDLEDLNNYVFE